jgi:colanic acid biosynthesis protein WcaH
MKIKQALKTLDLHSDKPEKGLPYDFFMFISRKTPMVNVDLLIKDKKGRTLLAWRKDKYSGAGWHVPGGIIRYKEKMDHRISEVAKLEIGAKVKFNKAPLAINQILLNQEERAHFISFLFCCSVKEGFQPENKCLKPGDAGYLKWHDKCPADLIKVHRMYKKYVNDKEICYGRK